MNFRAKLFKKQGGDLSIALDRAVVGSSHRFARRYGSEKFIRVRIDEALFTPDIGIDLVEMFQRPFIIFTRIFRAFYASEGGVWLFNTNEWYVPKEGKINLPRLHPQGPQSRNSLLDLLDWHNPVELNCTQVL